MSAISNSMAQRTCGNTRCTNPPIPEGQAKLCSRCKEVIYCNPECQKAAWPTHKAACDLIAKQSETASVNRIQFFSDEDVVSFSSYFCPKTTEQLKRNNYRGFASLKPELIKNCNYVEILKCLWTEDNLDKKITWLRKCAERGHPILMLELSRALIQKSEENAQESVKWFFLGLYCTRLDIACNEDVSTTAAIDVLKRSYSPAAQKAFEILGEKVPIIQKNVLEQFDPSQLQSSPKWVTLHGMDKYLGKSTLKEKGTWAETRLNRHKELIQRIK